MIEINHKYRIVVWGYEEEITASSFTGKWQMAIRQQTLAKPTLTNSA